MHHIVLKLCMDRVHFEYFHLFFILGFFQLPLWSGTLTLLDEVLLPSLSLMECNCAIAEEVWGLLRYFPYEIR